MIAFALIPLCITDFDVAVTEQFNEREVRFDSWSQRAQPMVIWLQELWENMAVVGIYGWRGEQEAVLGDTPGKRLSSKFRNTSPSWSWVPDPKVSSITLEIVMETKHIQQTGDISESSHNILIAFFSFTS